jgi:hypothetical protein
VYKRQWLASYDNDKATSLFKLRHERELAIDDPPPKRRLGRSPILSKTNNPTDSAKDTSAESAKTGTLADSPKTGTLADSPKTSTFAESVKVPDEQKSSFAIGLAGEQSVIDLLSPVYELDFHKSHSGDIIAKRDGKPIMIEIKNYVNTVPYKEVEKFYNDLDSRSTTIAGIFISLKSPITKIGKSIFLAKHNHQYVLFLVKPSSEVVLSMMNLLYSIAEHRSVNPDRLSVEIDKLEEMRFSITTLRSALSESKSAMLKCLDSSVQQIDILEYRFGETIRNMINEITVCESITDLPNDNIIEFVISKFADSALAKNEEHKLYFAKFAKVFSLDGNFTMKNKNNITWKSGHSANLLKTKTAITFKTESLGKLEITELSRYDVKTIGDWVKVELKPKNYPLLTNHIFCR